MDSQALQPQPDPRESVSHSVVSDSLWQYGLQPTRARRLAAAAAKSLQSCPTLCDPIDGSPPGSSVPGILQARILEWVAISFSRGSSWSSDRTQVSHITGRFFTTWVTREVKADPRSSVKRQVFHQWYTQGGWVSETLYWVEEARVRITVWSRLYSSDILKQVKPWSWRRDHSAEGQSEEKTRRWRHREGPTRCLI